mgnify:CR=1 FL=1
MDKETLIFLVEDNKSTWKIAEELKMSQSTIRYWLKKYGLKTKPVTDINLKNYCCKFCGETNKENFCNKGKGIISLTKCKKCHNQFTIERIRNYKKQAIEYKGGKCNICGYDRCQGSLHFHHINPLDKDPNWRQMKNWHFDKIKTEIDKCILVCANCHGEIHWNNDKEIKL